MINLDGLNGYNAIHGPWGKNSWPKAKCSESPPFPEPSTDTVSLMSRMSLCKDCPSQRVGTYNSSVPSLQLFGIGMSTGPGRANRSLADLTRKKEVERQNGELSFWADPLKWSTSAWRPRSFRMRLQTSWLTGQGQTEALPRIIFDTAETKKGSAWHLHPVVIGSTMVI